MIVIAIFIALLLDWLIGDPYSWPHPVKLIGNFIYACLKLENLKTKFPFLFGIFLWFSTVALTVSLTYGILWGASQLHPILYWGIWIYLAYTCLATRSLAFEALKVYKAIQSGSIEKARYQVGMIVGRETDQLSIPEICNATIETVA